MNTMIKNLKRGYMSAMAIHLLQPMNQVTTLELKTALRNAYPELNWTQGEVSKFMNDMHLAGELTYEDNGTYRTYIGEAAKKASSKKDPKTGKVIPKVKMTNVSKTKAFDMIMGNNGRFLTAEFIDKKGNVRVMNCQVLREQDPKLGYIKVKEASLMKSDPENAIRQINIQTLKSLKIAGVAYKIK